MGIADKTVKIELNEDEHSVTTSSGGESKGCFTLTLDLQPLNNEATTYQITACCDGDAAKTATAEFTTQDGTEYTACTTTFYGHKPSTNTTTITVEPQATDIVTTTKTPEQLQQEAEEKGWLYTWHGFTWSYAWYRMHFVNSYSGAIAFDVASARYLLETLSNTWNGSCKELLVCS